METETIGRDLLECIVPLFLLLAEPTGAVYVRNLQLLLQHFHSQLSSFYLLVSLIHSLGLCVCGGGGGGGGVGGMCFV